MPQWQHWVKKMKTKKMEVLYKIGNRNKFKFELIRLVKIQAKKAKKVLRLKVCKIREYKDFQINRIDSLKSK
jgi:hypothetical protein